MTEGQAAGYHAREFILIEPRPSDRQKANARYIDKHDFKMLKRHDPKADCIRDFIFIPGLPKDFVKNAFQNELTGAEARMKVNDKAEKACQVDKKAVAHKFDRVHVGQIQR